MLVFETNTSITIDVPIKNAVKSIIVINRPLRYRPALAIYYAKDLSTQ